MLVTHQKPNEKRYVPTRSVSLLVLGRTLLKINIRIDKATEGYVGEVRQGDAMDLSSLATRKDQALTWVTAYQEFILTGEIPAESEFLQMRPQL